MVGTAIVGARAMRPELPTLREPFNHLPMVLGEWTGQEAPPLTPAVLDALGVDEYINRIYTAGPGNRPVSLYVGYYQSQRSGDTIHSPQNCLPGAGWLPVATARREIRVEGRDAPISINRLLIRKGVDRQVVLYWYQSHGRVIASEYWSKAFLVYDAVRLNRSDAAMVRVIAPVLPGEADEAAAEQRAVAFVETVFPHLERFLPL
jgi:EpsI family protein